MPMYDLGSEDRDDDYIRWKAGGKSDVAILVGGERVYRGTIQKAEEITIAYADHEEGER